MSTMEGPLKTRKGFPMNIVVYTAPDCQQCIATERRLTRKGAKFEVRSLKDHPDIVERAKAAGMSTAPIVYAGEHVWSGYNPKLIREVV